VAHSHPARATRPPGAERGFFLMVAALGGPGDGARPPNNHRAAALAASYHARSHACYRKGALWMSVDLRSGSLNFPENVRLAPPEAAP